jgi:hypothetical protein
MAVPCHHDGLLSFSKRWDKFEGKLKTIKADTAGQKFGVLVETSPTMSKIN